MLRILLVYLLTHYDCVDAYFSRYFPRSTAISRDVQRRQRWSPVRVYVNAATRSAPRSAACSSNSRAETSRRGDGVGDWPCNDDDDATRSRDRRCRCRSKSRRADTLHARHDDTKYLTPYSTEYEYQSVNFEKPIALRKGKGTYKRKNRCDCRAKNRMLCADADYFREVFAGFERLMRRLLFDGGERKHEASGKRAERLEIPVQIDQNALDNRKRAKIRQKIVDDTKRTFTKIDKIDGNNDKNITSDKDDKKPFLHV